MEVQSQMTCGRHWVHQHFPQFQYQRHLPRTNSPLNQIPPLKSNSPNSSTILKELYENLTSHPTDIQLPLKIRIFIPNCNSLR